MHHIGWWTFRNTREPCKESGLCMGHCNEALCQPDNCVWHGWGWFQPPHVPRVWTHTSTQPQHSLNNKNITLSLDMHLIVLFWLLYNPSASLSTNHRHPHHPPPFVILEKNTPTTQDLVFSLLRHLQFMKNRPNHSDKPCNVNLHYLWVSELMRSLNVVEWHQLSKCFIMGKRKQNYPGGNFMRVPTSLWRPQFGHFQHRSPQTLHVNKNYILKCLNQRNNSVSNLNHFDFMTTVCFTNWMCTSLFFSWLLCNHFTSFSTKSQTSMSPTTISDYRKTTPTSQDLVFFTVFTIYE